MNKVLLVGRLTRDPELRSLPSGKHVATFTIATNEFRGGNNERTEYHPCVAWDRLAEITGQFLSKGQLVDIEGRLQTRQWDDDAGKRHWKTEVVVASLEMLERPVQEGVRQGGGGRGQRSGRRSCGQRRGGERPRGRRRHVIRRAAGLFPRSRRPITRGPVHANGLATSASPAVTAPVPVRPRLRVPAMPARSPRSGRGCRRSQPRRYWSKGNASSTASTARTIDARAIRSDSQRQAGGMPASAPSDPASRIPGAASTSAPTTSQSWTPKIVLITTSRAMISSSRSAQSHSSGLVRNGSAPIWISCDARPRPPNPRKATMTIPPRASAGEASRARTGPSDARPAKPMAKAASDVNSTGHRFVTSV